MSLPKTVLDCPHCQQSSDHRVHSYGDGTAIVWCGACHNPRELLMAQLRRLAGRGTLAAVVAAE
ncbi:hypothetical protein [Paramagnetospirillum magneticum]|uniref:hypothetical protein n=1 Tax=Paramagnetospirillum magneticum TaxID=84159 RepID=UPI0002D543BB|nr:hypothetical protein [Paramagnetospirillum magneticum]